MQYSGFITYLLAADSLKTQISGARLLECFSTGKDELILSFKTTGKFIFQLQLRFADGEMFITLPEDTMKAGQRHLQQFREIENTTVEDVFHISWDRSLGIRFENGHELILKGYGRFGNVLLYAHDQPLPVAHFRINLKADLQLERGKIAGPDADALSEAGESVLSNRLRFMPQECRDWLSAQGFEALDTVERARMLDQMLTHFRQAPWYADRTGELPSLSVEVKGEPLGTGMEALQHFAALYLRAFYFRQEKMQLLHVLKSRLRHQSQLLADTEQRLQNLQEKRSYRELGDIILTFAHQIKPGVSSAFLHDYYRNEQVRIKLDDKLDAAGNAEKYYRKARNEVIEREKLAELQRTLSETVNALKEQLANADKATSFAELRPFRSLRGAEERQPESRPYRLTEIEGYQVWIGKNAKGNDQMLRLAARNDLWLHARDCPGSHVIIRSNGARLSPEIIRQAAALAARHSKSKSHSLVPVIYTERKYVTKPRHAEPGEVAVMREQVIDVFTD